MDLNSYVETVRDGMTNAASLADENTQAVASRLGAALDSSTRLALIAALSDAASTISAELAPTSVELRMSGTEPQFVVSVPPATGQPTMLLPDEEPPEPEQPEDAEEGQARISLRLPASVKARVDELAAKDGISTNAWLVRAITDALSERQRGEGFPNPPRPPDWAVGFFGSNGPFGPHGVFGPGGPFGEAAREHGRRLRDEVRRQARREGWNGPGGVQGWAR